MKYILTFIFMSIIFDHSYAMRSFTTWQELQNSSDFIAQAGVVKIEKIETGRYRTTFKILKTYKGNPPETFSVDWSGQKGRDGQSHSFSTLDLHNHYLLFAKQADGKYCLLRERWMLKRRGGEANPFGLYYVKNLPKDLPNKKQIKWNDIANWLDEKYPDSKTNVPKYELVGDSLLEDFLSKQIVNFSLTNATPIECATKLREEFGLYLGLHKDLPVDFTHKKITLDLKSESTFDVLQHIAQSYNADFDINPDSKLIVLKPIMEQQKGGANNIGIVE
jgi:hypothetical protein